MEDENQPSSTDTLMSTWSIFTLPPPSVGEGGLLFKHPEAEFKKKHRVWDPRLELSQTSPYLRVESKVSFLSLIIINPKGKGVGWAMGLGHCYWLN